MIPFSRTMRSLNADSFRFSLAGLIIAMVLLIAWLLWFFFAQIALYEISKDVHINGGGKITVNFPIETQNKIRAGQTAIFRPSGSGGEKTSIINAIVMDVINLRQKKGIQVSLYMIPNPNSPFAIQDGLTGQIEIEVDRVTPSALVMRTTGQFLENPQNNSRGLK